MSMTQKRKGISTKSTNRVKLIGTIKKKVKKDYKESTTHPRSQFIETIKKKVQKKKK